MDSVPGAAAPSAALRLGRRTYVVDRRFQYKYSLVLSALGAVMSTLFGLLMYLAHRDALDEALAGAPLSAQAAARSDTLLWLIVGTAILMAVALALFGILVTHRVAGPVYVMSHYVSVLARGRFPMLRPLRRNDELREFFQHFQSAITSLREKEIAEADVLEQVMARLASTADGSETGAAIADLRALAARKRDAASPLPPSRTTGQKSAA